MLIRHYQICRHAGPALEEQSIEVLMPLLKQLLQEHQHDAAVTVVQAMLVSQSDNVTLLRLSAHLETLLKQPLNAIKSYSSLFQLGAGSAGDYMSYAVQLAHAGQQQAAVVALSKHWRSVRKTRGANC